VVSLKDVKTLKDRLIKELIELTAQETQFVGVNDSPILGRLKAILWVLIHKQLINIDFSLPEIMAVRE
jgi:hypothetical protein